MLTITDINGVTEALTDYKSLAIKRQVNGDRSLSFIVIPTARNSHSYDLVAEESIVEYGGDRYRIKQAEERALGNRSVKRVAAQHVFFDLIDEYKYDVTSGSKTLGNALDWTLAGTDYTYTIIGSFASEEFENFGDDNVLALLQTIISRYGVEFTIDGTHLTFRAKIGVTTDMQLRYRHNLKTLAKHADTSKLSTFIRGYGKDGLTAEYTSPHVDTWGLKHAKPVRDERYTSEASLLERLQNELVDEPEISFTAEYAELKKAGFTYEQFGLGDEIYVIYEPMGIDIMARIVEYEEYPEQPDATKITLANFRTNASDILADFGRVSKQVDRLFNGQERLPYNALNEAVQRATEALQSAQTELEFENGIIARSKINPNHIVLFNSAGVGVSVDGGQTFRTAMTAEGIVADLITTGTMLADRIQGGLFTLGGPANGNGKMQVLNANGDVIADLDAERGGFSRLYCDDLISPTVARFERLGTKNFYISSYNVYPGNQSSEPSDNNVGDSFNRPLATISEALRRLPRVFTGNVNIYLAEGSSFYEYVEVPAFLSSGVITIDGQTVSTKLYGSFSYGGGTPYVELKNVLVQSREGYKAISFDSTKGRVTGCKVYGAGTNGTENGILAVNGATIEVVNTESKNVQYALSARYGGFIHNINNGGYGSVAGVMALGGTVTGTGTHPSGLVATQEVEGGRIAITSPSANSGGTVPSSPNLLTLNASQSSSESWRPQFGGQWTASSFGAQVLQGSWAGFGAYKGCWFFGSALDSTQGKTIRQIRVYAKRLAEGGLSGEVPVVFRAHGYASKPAGEPSYLAPTHTVNFAWGAEKWVTLPSSFHAVFESGSAKGFGIFASGTTDNYAKMASALQVEITYV